VLEDSRTRTPDGSSCFLFEMKFNDLRFCVYLVQRMVRVRRLDYHPTSRLGSSFSCCAPAAADPLVYACIFFDWIVRLTKESPGGLYRVCSLIRAKSLPPQIKTLTQFLGVLRPMHAMLLKSAVSDEIGDALLFRSY
jgi:hypothetical protein